MPGLNSVRFSCSALANSSKQGHLVKSEDGYYTTVLGGLNVFNSAGEYYSVEGVRQLFASSGLLQKRIARGRLRGEYGHPKQMPGESDEKFINRIFLINEDRICVHFKEIYLDDTNVKNDAGQPQIAIIGKIIPSGPFGDALQKSLDNKDENVCFSIRAFTDDQRIRGVNNRFLKTIVTWDYVNDPGIAIAEKFKSPALEGMAIDLESRSFSRGQIERGVKPTGVSGLAQESASMNVNELFTSLGWSIRGQEVPAFVKW